MISSIYSKRTVCCNGRTMPFIRVWLVACLLVVAGCPGEVPPRDEDGPMEDEIDAPLATMPDARVDARVVDAMGPAIDAPNSCMVNGVTGMCIDKTICTNMGKVATAGHCPGTPANIQCCTPP
jgi:hypothetical protein